MSGRDVEAAGETKEDMFCYTATPGGQSVQGGGENLRGSCFAPKGAKSYKICSCLYINCAKTKNVELISVVLILPNWLSSRVLVI